MGLTRFRARTKEGRPRGRDRRERTRQPRVDEPRLRRKPAHAADEIPHSGNAARLATLIQGGFAARRIRVILRDHNSRLRRRTKVAEIIFFLSFLFGKDPQTTFSLDGLRPCCRRIRRPARGSSRVYVKHDPRPGEGGAGRACHWCCCGLASTWAGARRRRATKKNSHRFPHVSEFLARGLGVSRVGFRGGFWVALGPALQADLRRHLAQRPCRSWTKAVAHLQATRDSQLGGWAHADRAGDRWAVLNGQTPACRDHEGRYRLDRWLVEPGVVWGKPSSPRIEGGPRFSRTLGTLSSVPTARDAFLFSRASTLGRGDHGAKLVPRRSDRQPFAAAKLKEAEGLGRTMIGNGAAFPRWRST